MNEVPVDPDVATMFATLLPAEPVVAADLTAEQHRQLSRDLAAYFTEGAEDIEIDHVSDDVVAGSGADIPVRLYVPESPTAVIVYKHGGSWMTGGLDQSDPAMRRLSRDTRSVVVSVDYRMVPEHPFPAPFDDSYDAVVWAASRWPDLPLIVAGDSAGGTLATCIALRARDEAGPRIDGQVLIYPATDYDLDAPSMHAFGPDIPVSREDMRFLIGQYADQEASADSPYALPSRAATLAGLPPAVIAIAGYDRLRSSEELYAQQLEAAGVPVTVQLDLELTHAWFDYAPRIPAADRAFTRLTDNVNDLIAQVGRPA